MAVFSVKNLKAYGEAAADKASEVVASVDRAMNPTLEDRLRLSEEAAAGKKRTYESSRKGMFDAAPTTMVGKFMKNMAQLADPGGKSLDQEIDDSLKFANIREAKTLDNIEKEKNYQKLVKKGSYEDPGSIAATGYGMGRFYDRINAGSKEIYHENVPNFIESKYDSGRALEKLYDEQRSNNEIVDATIGFKHPFAMGVGEQLALAPLDVPGIVSKGIIKGAGKTLLDGSLSYPMLSRNAAILGGKSPLSIALKAHPKVAAEQASREFLPAVFPWMDNLTPKIERLKNAATSNKEVDRVASLFRDGEVERNGLTAARDLRGIRPGSNEFSRAADSIVRGVAEGTNPLTMGIREGIRGGTIGALDIDQTAGSGALVGAGMGALAKAAGGAISRPTMTSNPYSRRMIKQAEKAGYPVIDPIRTGDLDAQTTWSAIKNNNPNSAKEIADSIAFQHNRNITKFIDPENPQSTIEENWLKEQIGVLAEEKEDIASSMRPVDLTPEAHAKYIDEQEALLRRKGGERTEPVLATRPAKLGLLDAEGNPISGPEDFVLKEGEDALTSSEATKGTKNMIKGVNKLFENGSITGDQYRFYSKELADQMRATQDPIERSILRHASKTLDDVASTSPGMDTNAFKNIGVKQALAFNLLEDGVTKGGNIVPGKLNKYPMLPDIAKYEEAVQFVDPSKIRGATLSKMDQASAIMGHEKMGWPSLFGEKLFTMTNSPGLREIAAKAYMVPSSGISASVVNPFVAPIARSAVLNNKDPNYDERIEKYYKRY
jgi:hypothetical protein